MRRSLFIAEGLSHKDNGHGLDLHEQGQLDDVSANKCEKFRTEMSEHCIQRQQTPTKAADPQIGAITQC